MHTVWTTSCYLHISERESVGGDPHRAYWNFQDESVARMHVWWPKIDADIEQIVSRCTPCQEHSKDPVKAPLHHWEEPGEQWKCIHVDLLVPSKDSCGSLYSGCSHKMAGSYCHEVYNSNQDNYGLQITFSKVWHTSPDCVR